MPSDSLLNESSVTRTVIHCEPAVTTSVAGSTASAPTERAYARSSATPASVPTRRSSKAAPPARCLEYLRHWDACAAISRK